MLIEVASNELACMAGATVMMMMMIVFTSGGVSTEYRPDRACHPHFSYGAAYEGF